MADLTPEEAAQFQIRLANGHRLALSQIATLTIDELNILFDALQHESDAVFAKAIRDTVPAIVDKYTPSALVLATGYYQTARKLYELSGQLTGGSASFVPNNNDYLKTQMPQQITDSLINTSFYHFNNAINNDNRQACIAPIRDLAQDAIFDTSRQAITVHSEADPVADNEPRRNVTSGGCPFCKTMAFHVGVNDGNFHHTDSESGKRVQKFHKGCGCVTGPAFRNEMIARPDWADKYEADYSAAHKEIMDANAALTVKTEKVDGRFQKVYYDADGNVAKPTPLTTDNIINGMRRADYADSNN